MADVTLEAMRRSLRAKLQDDAQLIAPDEVETNIEDALRQLNLDHPLLQVSDLAGDGTADIALPTDFLKGYSVLKDVETPVEDPPLTPPSILDVQDDYFNYEDPSKPADEQQRLRFRCSAPQVGQVVRVSYTTEYTLTETSSNLDPHAYLAVMYQGLVLCFRTLAARFTQSQDPTILADAVDYGGRSGQFLFLSERHQAAYKAAVGIGTPVKAAQAMVDWDIGVLRRADFIWHPRRSR